AGPGPGRCFASGAGGGSRPGAGLRAPLGTAAQGSNGAGPDGSRGSVVGGGGRGARLDPRRREGPRHARPAGAPPPRRPGATPRVNMHCREVREELRRSEASRWSAAALRHASSCRACGDEARAVILLRFGSEPGAEELPRAGFEDRLRARLASLSEAPRRSTWNGGFEVLGRPALAAGAALTLLCAFLYVRVASQEPGGDLVSLIDVDPVLTSLLGDAPDEILAEPQDAPTSTEGP